MTWKFTVLLKKEEKKRKRIWNQRDCVCHYLQQDPNTYKVQKKAYLLIVVEELFCSLTKGITLKIGKLCVCVLTSTTLVYE